MTHKGWFKIDGVQDGDRTIEQQMLGLDTLLMNVQGKSVLDLGCAEGLIARELVHAGAGGVMGVEIVKENVEEARRQCEGLPIDFYNDNVEDWLANYRGRTNIVLALAILHKLKNPIAATRYIARIATSLIVIRLPASTPGYVLDQRSGNVVHDVQNTLEIDGWQLADVQKGPFDEWVGYFRHA